MPGGEKVFRFSRVIENSASDFLFRSRFRVTLLSSTLASPSSSAPSMSNITS